MSNDKNIVPLGTMQNQYQGFLKRLTHLDKNDIITRPNCKFCNHPARKEGEEKWERSGGSYATVERFFANYHKEHPEHPKMNYNNIRAHIDNHYQQQLKRLRMREYGNHLTEIMNEKVSQAEAIHALKTSIKMKYFDIASDPSLETARQADAQNKLAKTYLDIMKFEAELSGDLRPLNIFAEKVLNVFTHEIENESDAGFQQKLLEMIDKLQAEVGPVGGS